MSARIFDKKNKFERAALIYNPNAGKGTPFEHLYKKALGVKYRKFDRFENTGALIQAIIGYFREFGIKAEVQATKCSGDATRIAHDVVNEGYDLIVAVGGDGTINEVVNGMTQSDSVLGVIPLGTANLFALQMNLPAEIKAACEVISFGNIKSIDLGKIGSRYFVSVAGVGFDADILRKADTGFRKIIGGFSYPLTVMSEIFNYPFKKIEIQINGDNIRKQGEFVIISNSRYYIGSRMIAPHADMNDGLLDVSLFKSMNVFRLTEHLFQMSHGILESSSNVEFLQCRNMLITGDSPYSVHADAEYVGKTPVTITAEHNALQVVV